MPDKKAPRKGTRIKVDKLQKEEKELTKEEQKKVKGGALGGGIWLDAANPKPKQ